MWAAPLNNRGSHLRQAIGNRWLFLFLQGLKAVATRFYDKTGYPAYLLGILIVAQLEFIFRFLKNVHLNYNEHENRSQ